MHVNFVSTESRSVMADLGKVEHRALIEEPADRKHGPRRTIGAAHQNVVGIFDRRAIEQAVDGVNVTLARRATPEVEARRRF